MLSLRLCVVEVLDAQVVGERLGRADIVVAPFPSDHRAVVVTVRLRRR